MKQHLVVIGNGMAGMRCVEELLALNPDLYQITVFGSEPYGNYNRIMLTPLLAGSKSLEQIMLHDFAWYKQHQIRLHCGPAKTVVAIDRQQKQLVTQDGCITGYDRLLIATGSLPLMPDMPGIDLAGVSGFRSIADVETLITASSQHQRAVIVGGGLLGIEAAYALQQRGMSVTILNRAGHLLNRQLDPTAAGFLQKHLEMLNLSIELNCSVSAIHGCEGRIQQVELDDGRLLAADLLVIATGIQPNISLAQASGLICERGIVVNDKLQSSDPAIYAIGECIEHRGEIFGLVAPVYQQAKLCAQQLAGQISAAYRSSVSATMLKVTGIDLFSLGKIESDPDCQSQIMLDQGLGIYRKLVFKNQRLIGAILYGDTRHSGYYMKLISQDQAIDEFRSQLLFSPPVQVAA